MYWNRTGDYTVKDWEQFLPCSYDEYVAPVKEMLDRLKNQPSLRPGYPDRDDLLRPTFNELVPPCGKRTQDGVDRFYLSDWYQRVRVFETSREGGLSGYEGGLQVAERDHSDEPIFVGSSIVGKRTNGKFKMLDHGFGSGYLTYTVMGLYPEAEFFLIDFPSPSNRLFAWSLAKYMPSYKVTFIWLPFTGAFDEVTPTYLCGKERENYKKQFDFIVSHEVLEHCFDPVGEAQRLSSALNIGGLAYISVFFNSICGKNPSHLDEHIKFQEWQLWFEELKKMGLHTHLNDPRGVCKIFIKSE